MPCGHGRQETIPCFGGNGCLGSLAGCVTFGGMGWVAATSPGLKGRCWETPTRYLSRSFCPVDRDGFWGSCLGSYIPVHTAWWVSMTRYWIRCLEARVFCGGVWFAFAFDYTASSDKILLRPPNAFNLIRSLNLEAFSYVPLDREERERVRPIHTS